MSDLIDSTGYSYSGVTDLIRNSEDNETEAYNLLCEINEEYNRAKKEQEQLEAKLEKVKSKRGQMVSMFLYVHEAMEISGDLVFQQQDEIVKIQKLDENRIDYSKIELTDFSKLNK